jgi:hypothetical protein
MKDTGKSRKCTPDTSTSTAVKRFAPGLNPSCRKKPWIKNREERVTCQDAHSERKGKPW